MLIPRPSIAIPKFLLPPSAIKIGIIHRSSSSVSTQIISTGLWTVESRRITWLWGKVSKRRIEIHLRLLRHGWIVMVIRNIIIGISLREGGVGLHLGCSLHERREITSKEITSHHALMNPITRLLRVVVVTTLLTVFNTSRMLASDQFICMLLLVFVIEGILFINVFLRL